jgi:hypothetical protein
LRAFRNLYNTPGWPSVDMAQRATKGREAKAAPADNSLRGLLKRFWHFLWYEDSVASWTVSIALSFILIKFVLYPLMGLALGTQFPVVAVVSDSMEHNQDFDAWWARHEDYYLRYNITRNEFVTYPMPNGFDKGDLILLLGTPPDEIERGDIIVYWGGKAYPIIHRAVATYDQDTALPRFATKGDNNLGQIVTSGLDERNIPAWVACSSEADGKCDVLLGRAVLRIPWLGWVKIGFVNLLNSVGVRVA